MILKILGYIIFSVVLHCMAVDIGISVGMKKGLNIKRSIFNLILFLLGFITGILYMI